MQGGGARSRYGRSPVASPASGNARLPHAPGLHRVFRRRIPGIGVRFDPRTDRPRNGRDHGRADRRRRGRSGDCGRHHRHRSDPDRRPGPWLRVPAGGSAPGPGRRVADGPVRRGSHRGEPGRGGAPRPGTVLATRRRTPGSAGRWGAVHPPATDDRVYTTAFGEVFCTAADRDALHWRGPEHGMDGIGYPPVVTDDAVFVGSGGFEETPPQVRAFGLDGRQRWRTELPSEARTSPSVSGDRLMIGTQDGLVGLDATTGEVLYTVSESVSEFRVPVLDDGAAFATVNENRPGREVVSLDPADGTVRWRRELGGAYPPIVAGDRLYTEVDDAIAVLDSTDGERVGTLDADGIPVALAGEVVYARAREEVLAADVETGERLWRYDVDRDLDPGEGGYGIGITPAGGAVYVSVDGSVVGFGPGA
ncbi:hypothetical protein BRD00_05375 [Halobacteriales archaeon QS_8_69_26]|nr:MAG: hypothetical protein BRD00_05375 [Halobacteriales archaeon QS_8_69_26]